MRAFINRTQERDTLEDQFRSGEASMVVIYGRRRIGKTALITEFLKHHEGLYFLATEESESQNMRTFQQQVAEFTGNPLLREAAIGNWDILFDQLTQGDEKIVIALDEFQNLGKANPAFPSILQRIWDTVLSKRDVMLILCGSLISLMESQVLSHSSPLYGRRTAQIRMQQIPFSHYGEFYTRSYSYRDLIMLYSVTGGVPKYIESFHRSTDIYEGIEANILNSNSYLFDEPNFLLSKEIGEVGTFFSILRAIAFGNRKSGDIAATLNTKQTSLSKYLKILENMDILERAVPVTELNPEKSKKGLYGIKDNYLRFWFRFIFPHKGLLETGRVRDVLKDIKQNFLDAHVSYIYESICRERVWELADEGILPFGPNRVGAWWGAKDVELDVVALDMQDHAVAFGECKFWKKPVGVGVLTHLEQQAEKALREPAFKAYTRKPVYLIFGIAGFTDALMRVAKERDDVILAS